MDPVHFSHRRVRPVHPAAAYIGGKKQLARRLVNMISAVPHETYAEPFIGMGGVLHLTAPGAVDGIVPRRNWIILGITMGVAAFVAIVSSRSVGMASLSRPDRRLLS